MAGILVRHGSVGQDFRSVSRHFGLITAVRLCLWSGSVVLPSPCQGEGREFESLHPLVCFSISRWLSTRLNPSFS